jgi:hypothetical protein
MPRPKIEQKTKPIIAGLISLALLIVGIYFIVPAVTNYEITLASAFILSALLAVSISLAIAAEDLTDELLRTKNLGSLVEMIVILLLTLIIFAYLLDLFMIAPMSVKLLVLAITVVVDKLSKPITKLLNL